MPSVSTINKSLALVTALRRAVVHQSLSLLCRAHRAARHPGQQGPVQSVVEPRAQQQDQEAQDLEALEVLPAQRQAHHPDDQGAQAVQHHAGGGADLLGDADAGEVEEGDADRVAEQSQDDEGLVSDLAEGVQRVLQHPPGVVAEAAHVDEVHGDEQQRQDEETKETWKQKTKFHPTCRSQTSWRVTP